MRRLPRLAATAVLAASLLVAALAAQTPGTSGRGAAPAKGLIVGRVVDAVSNTPIASVIVSLSGAPLPSSIRVMTDAKGRFLFRNVPRGSFSLRATIGGNVEAAGFTPGFGPHVGPYLVGGYGQRRPGGAFHTIDVGDGEQITDADIRLWQSGSIDGIVQDEAGEPLVAVFVAAARRSSDGRLLNGPSTRTDDRGAYHLSGLVPGDYVIVVPTMQAAIPPGTSDELAAATSRTTPLGARLANSGSRSFTGGIQAGTSLIGLADWPNVNVLPPAPRDGALHVYQTTFAPSAATLAAAAAITIGPGEMRAGVDVSMHPVRAVAVSGTLTDNRGPVPNFGLRLFTREEDTGGVGFDIAFTSTDARGEFTFPLVPAGDYLLAARRYATTHFGPDVVLPPAPPGPESFSERYGAYAEQAVSVGEQDVSGLALQLRLPVTVSGRVVFRGSGKRPTADVMRQLRVFVAPWQPTSRSFYAIPMSNGVDAKDGVTIPNVVPGKYFLTVTDSAAVSLLSVAIGGKPVTEEPFAIGPDGLSGVTVELTDRPAAVTGSVRTRAGAADANAGVVLFPTNRARWQEIRPSSRLFRHVRVLKGGTFSVRPVLPGEYFVAAVADDATGQFPEQKFLESLAAVATTVNVGVGETSNVVLTTVDVGARAPMPASAAPVTVSLRSALTGNEDSTRSFAESTRHGPFADESVVARELLAQAVTVGLTGVVTTDETPSRPLRRAIVTVTAAELRGARQAVTDDEGRFAFSALPPGRYSLVVEKPGYVKTFYGSTRPGDPRGTPVAALAGQPAPHLAMRVPRGAVIAGMVRDQFGMPISAAQVSVKHAVVIKGRRQMVDVPNAPAVITDDQGRYRIYGLPPGEYTVFCSIPGVTYRSVQETDSADVEAILREARAGRGAPASTAKPRQVSLSGGYLPGVPDEASAQMITLGVGDALVGADILVGPLRALSVTGMSVGPGGKPMRHIMVAVVNNETGTRVGHAGVVMPDTSGRFVLTALPPGRYTLMGRAAEDGAGEGDPMPYFAETEFVLHDENISSLVLQFERGITITGRIVPPAGTAIGEVAKVRLGAEPVNSYASLVPTRVIATTRPNGTFVFDGVGPGEWRVTAASLPSGWTLRSAELGGRDTLDLPFEVRLGQPIADLTVTMTDRPTELTGTVLDASGRPTSEYSMLAFSADRALWETAPRRVSSPARLSSDGRYRISGLPPGEYYLTMLTDSSLALDNPSVLESLIPRAVKVVLGEGERKVQDYQIR